MRTAQSAAAAIMMAAALAGAPGTASAAPEPARLVASYTSDGALGYWNAHFRGKATVVEDDGTFQVSGYLEATCPGGVVNGFGRFGFRNQDTGSAWKTFDLKCGSGGSTSMSIDADGVGDPGDVLGITVCMGGFLTYTECGGEETVTLTG